MIVEAQPRMSSGATLDSVDEHSQNHHRDDIQGLRAVAVLMVVGFHAGLPMPGGFTGVDVFFVISGFVITSMLQREWRQRGEIDFAQFYWRRFKRLAPALAVMIIVALIGSLFLVSLLGPQARTVFTGGAALFMMANFAIAATTGGYFEPSAETNALLHTWSLSVEEQFYLAFPLLLALGWRLARGRSKYIPAGVVLAFAVVSFVICLSQAGDLSSFYGPLARAWEFAVGALLALLGPLGRRVPRWVSIGTALAGAGLLVVATFAINRMTAFPGGWTLVPVAGALALILAGTWRNPISRMLSSGGMRFIGDRSYSLYLWHWPLVVWAANLWPDRPAATIVAAAASSIPAYVSYRFVEVPFRRWSPEGRAQAVGWASSIVAVPLIVALCLGMAVANNLGSPRIAARSAAMELHVGARHRCHADAPKDGWNEERCTWGSGSGGAPIYLVGDSHADHFSDAVVAAGRELGRPVVVSTHGSCPMLETSLWNVLRGKEWNRGCHRYVADTISWLTRSAPGLVILADSDRYLREDGYGFGSSLERLASDRDARIEAWTRGKAGLVATLERAGHEVLLIQTVPRWEGVDAWDGRECTLAGLLAGGESWCTYRMSLAEANRRQADSRRAFVQIARDSQARVLDFGPTICPDGTCATATGDHVSYRDFEHLTVAANEGLVPGLVTAIGGKA